MIANGFTNQGPNGPNPGLPFELSSPVSSNKVWLEFRVEGGNLLNHPVFGNPTGDVTSATFMQIQSIPGGNPGNVGLSNAVYMERQIRLGLRFQF